MKAALQSGCLYLMHPPEFCHVDGGTHNYCLRPSGVAFYDEEKRKLSFRDAQRAVAMSIVNRGSNADQARAGCTRRLNYTGLEIDAVNAVANMLQSRSDEWLVDPFRPLFELGSGEAAPGARISEVI